MSDSKQRVMVVGAAGALGRAVVQAFREQGATLALLDRHEDALTHALGPAPPGELYLACDILRSEELIKVAGNAVAAIGGLDAVCHVAGGFEMGPEVHTTTDELWDRMMNLNARAFLNVARAVVPHMQARGGSIVAVGAWGAQRGSAAMGAYAASKRAMQALVESLSAEQRERGIRVNAVLPSIIDTPANRSAMPQADPSRWVSPRDLANVITFLSSDASRAIHGASIPVQGLS